MPNVVFDASSLVAALLKQDSIPDPKFAKYLTPGRAERVMDILTAAAATVLPAVAVTDCRDAKDNKYLELALAAGAEVIVASDDDLLVLDPWRGVRIVAPAIFVGWREQKSRRE